MIILEVVTVGGLQLAAAPTVLVNLHAHLAAPEQDLRVEGGESERWSEIPDVMFTVRPLGLNQHHLHR